MIYCGGNGTNKFKAIWQDTCDRLGWDHALLLWIWPFVCRGKQSTSGIALRILNLGCGFCISIVRMASRKQIAVGKGPKRAHQPASGYIGC